MFGGRGREEREGRGLLERECFFFLRRTDAEKTRTFFFARFFPLSLDLSRFSLSRSFSLAHSPGFRSIFLNAQQQQKKK